LTRSVEEQLSRVPLYKRLTEQDRSELASVCHLESSERGSEVFAEGDPANRFFTVVKGRIKVFKGTPDGRIVILEIFGPGDPVGAVAVYEELPYPATAVALEPTTCLCSGRRCRGSGRALSQLTGLLRLNSCRPIRLK
jgi:CRP/FNR family transcriptional regulator